MMSSAAPASRSGTLRRWRAATASSIRRLRALAVEAFKDAVLRVRFALLPRPKGAPDRATGRLHVLMADDLVPDPLFGAGYPRAFAIIRALVKAGHDVDFCAMAANRSDLRRMDAAFDGAVRFRTDTGPGGLRRLLWREGARFDVAFVSRSTAMRALDATPRPAGAAPFPPIIYDAEAVLAPREAQRHALFGLPWSPALHRAALEGELLLAGRARVVTAVGEQDAAVIRSVLDKPVYVLPHPVAVRAHTPGFADRADLLIVGRLTGPATLSPNVDAVLWFAAAVMPVLDQLIGTNWRLHVVGRVENDDIVNLASDRIILHGVVDDLRPLYDACRVFVAPARYAAGIPLKVVEAMGECVPCAVTPLLARQLAADASCVAVGEGPDGFAAACAELYVNEQAWTAVRMGALVHVERHFSPPAFDRVLAEALDDSTGRTVTTSLSATIQTG